jgi:hypothetical protein
MNGRLILIHRRLSEDGCDSISLFFLKDSI